MLFGDDTSGQCYCYICQAMRNGVAINRAFFERNKGIEICLLGLLIYEQAMKEPRP
ncbi:hypothetical protein LCGC14_1672460 [marine sediment metagenome]|uniref:Uncharacterized protein n=1 Tax=marine sediment metagenome TaxID=412755 RepID=A0A0F9HRM2_9ZZZZ